MIDITLMWQPFKGSYSSSHIPLPRPIGPWSSRRSKRSAVAKMAGVREQPSSWPWVKKKDLWWSMESMLVWLLICQDLVGCWVLIIVWRFLLHLGVVVRFEICTYGFWWIKWLDVVCSHFDASASWQDESKTVSAWTRLTSSKKTTPTYSKYPAPVDLIAPAPVPIGRWILITHRRSLFFFVFSQSQMALVGQDDPTKKGHGLASNIKQFAAWPWAKTSNSLLRPWEWGVQNVHIEICRNDFASSGSFLDLHFKTTGLNVSCGSDL